MTDGVAIDWSLLRQPDPLNRFVNAFEAGRRLVVSPSEAPTGNAFALTPPAPAPARSTAPPTPDPARLDALTGEARTRAAQQADLLASLGAGLKAYDYGERRAILAHMAPVLVARGLAPQAVAGFDPTDANLDEATDVARQMLTRLTAPPPPV